MRDGVPVESDGASASTAQRRDEGRGSSGNPPPVQARAATSPYELPPYNEPYYAPLPALDSPPIPATPPMASNQQVATRGNNRTRTARRAKAVIMCQFMCIFILLTTGAIFIAAGIKSGREDTNKDQMIVNLTDQLNQAQSTGKTQLIIVDRLYEPI